MDRSSAADDGEDLLSALHDDVLLRILGRLLTAAEAAQTSVLSRRWRGLWTRLTTPLFFRDERQVAPALAAHQGNRVNVAVNTADPDLESVAAWLTLAAPRLSQLVFRTRRSFPADDGEEEEEEEGGVLQLPCLPNTMGVALFLEFLDLALPPAGVFSRLTMLSLDKVRFHGAGELGDLVSHRCPSLKRLTIFAALGLGTHLAIHSDTLGYVALWFLDGVQQLTIVAPELTYLQVFNCFARTPAPVVNISTPKLMSLVWRDPYDLSTARIGDLTQFMRLVTNVFHVFGHDHFRGHNQAHLISLLRRFCVIVDNLVLTLAYRRDIRYLQYLMPDMTRLPRVTFLELAILSNGHAFGASVFHVLGLCTGIKKLSLVLDTRNDSQAQFECPPGSCLCDQLMTNWENAELKLNCLQEVELIDVRGTEHEVTFIKHLFSWATVLQQMRITFAYSVSESMVSELRPRLLSFGRPEVRVEFQTQHDPDDRSIHLLLAELSMPRHQW